MGHKLSRTHNTDEGAVGSSTGGQSSPDGAVVGSSTGGQSSPDGAVVGSSTGGQSSPSGAAAPPPPSSPSTADNKVAAIVTSDGDSEGGPSVETPRQAREEVPLSFSDEERREAWHLSGYDTATRQEQPLALWIVGPSAVGKSTLANDVAPELGIPHLRPGTGRKSVLAQSGQAVLDAVLVDGHFFREAHSTYKLWAKSADWATAYPSLKPVINKEKQVLQDSAAGERKHLVIPQTCLHLSKCLSAVRDLTESGYINHVLAVTAPREEVARRGYAREQATGKRYAPTEFEHSMAAISPMITACNGNYQLVKSHEQILPPGQEMFRIVEKEVLASGACGSDPMLPAEVLGGQ